MLSSLPCFLLFAILLSLNLLHFYCFTLAYFYHQVHSWAKAAIYHRTAVVCPHVAGFLNWCQSCIWYRENWLGYYHSLFFYLIGCLSPWQHGNKNRAVNKFEKWWCTGPRPGPFLYQTAFVGSRVLPEQLLCAMLWRSMLKRDV